jgi:hypothetical protein
MSSRPFKRMVVGLPQGMGNQAAVQAAIDLAERLQIELLGAFIGDTTLLALAGFPAMRELRALDQQWQPFDVERVARELECAAAMARRRFDENARLRTIKTAFDVLQGVDAIMSLVEAGDILAVIEPSRPGETMTRQFAALLDAAFATAGSILAVPRRIARRRGPIMAVAGGASDPSIHIGLDIAAALRERLIVVIAPGMHLAPEIIAEANRLAVVIEEMAANPYDTSAPLLASPSNERLRVVTRAGLRGNPAQLFAILHGVPLLLVDSPDSSSAAGASEPPGVKASSA